VSFGGMVIEAEFMNEDLATTERSSANRLVGTWERQGLDGMRQIKMFNATHFVWAIHVLPTGAALGVGGGTYRFDGVRLIEVYEYSTAPQLLGKQLTLVIDFQSPDDLTTTGVAAIPGISQDEVYRRIK
jgi:hypothetical protein